MSCGSTDISSPNPKLSPFHPAPGRSLSSAHPSHHLCNAYGSASLTQFLKHPIPSTHLHPCWSRMFMENIESCSSHIAPWWSLDFQNILTDGSWNNSEAWERLTCWKGAEKEIFNIECFETDLRKIEIQPLLKYLKQNCVKTAKKNRTNLVSI